MSLRRLLFSKRKRINNLQENHVVLFWMDPHCFAALILVHHSTSTQFRGVGLGLADLNASYRVGIFLDLQSQHTVLPTDSLFY